MDDQNHRSRAFADQIRHRPAGPPQRGPHAGARRRPLHRRHQPARPGLCRDRAQPRRPRRHPSHRHRRRQGDAGRARRSTPAPISTGYGTLKCTLPFKNRDGSPITQHAAAGARRPTRCASSAIRSPAWSPRRVAQAKDAAEAVALDIEPLPAVTDAGAGGRSPARRCSIDDVPGNVALDYHYGDAEKVAAAFAKRRARHQAQAAQQPHGRQRHGAARGDRRITTRPAAFTLHSVQPGRDRHEDRADRTSSTRRADKVRVLTGNVGGSFGMKAAVYPEYVCILHAARALGRPVKWTDERSGSFVSDNHGRDHDMTVEARARRRRPFPGAAARPATAISAAISAPIRRRCCRPLNIVQERRQPLPHAADRSVDQVRVHQHHASCRPIAAPAGPRATTTWSG